MKNDFLFFLIIFSGIISPSTGFAWNRIITLNPMISEWTAEILGKEKTLQKVIGASEYSNYPDYLKKIKTVGPYPQVQIENILNLHPDLVIGSSEYNRVDQLAQLKKLNLNVVILPPERFSKMEEWINELGKILDEQALAKKAADHWKSELLKIKAPKLNLRAFFQIQFQPLITVGKNSFLTDAFLLAGYSNVFAGISQSYPKVSREAVLEKTPEQVFIFEMVKNHEDLEKIKDTWKSSKVQVLNGDGFSRCSLRLLRALREIE